MLPELAQIEDLLRLRIRPTVGVPPDVDAIREAYAAATSIDQDDERARLVAAIRAGDAEAAAGASRAVAAPWRIDGALIEATAYDALHNAIVDGPTWHDLRAAYASAVKRLTEIVQTADILGPPPIMASEKTRRAFVDAPAAVAALDRIADAVCWYVKTIGGDNPDDARLTAGRLPLLMLDDRAIRRQAVTLWQDRSLDSTTKWVRLLALGAKLKAPADPEYADWTLPEIIDGVDPLTATDAEVKEAIYRVTGRRSPWL